MINPIRIFVSFLALTMCFSFQGFKHIPAAVPGNNTADIDTSVSSEKKTLSTPPASAFKVVIKKSAYEMTLYDEEGWYGTYPVVFGNKSQMTNVWRVIG